MFTFCALNRFLHLDPIKTVVAEETAVFHLPNAIEKIIGDPFERDPTTLNFATVSFGDHRLDSAKNHQGGDRRIEKANIDDPKNGNEGQDQEDEESNAKPRAAFFPRFTRHHLILNRNGSTPSGR